ncbi:hypothetical protein ES708_10316 [subsurface metagenome]
MSATVDGIDAVGETERRLGKAVVILQGGFDNGAVNGAENIDRPAVAHHPVAVKVADKAGNAPLEIEGPLLVLPLVADAYLQPFI